ncbi:MAG: DUF192 domain-containing protein [Nitrospira sp.]|nr:DUF192 domain-containing protein [Nitrospira sp.]MCA9465053.1 DUF192 domain-containing protein [Nitrospira sp.]MCA9476585.1 DUF192 domain-containing protein [Nitrospira sp.]MCB9710653.1 DUF192 domain-containing protein [Nitrospiraceae bacterium]MDR4486876.1 DUF192 domain-containing protein [Nitrospirales bacterium]
MLPFLQAKGGPDKKRIVFLIVMAILLITGALMFNAPEQTDVISIAFPGGGILNAEVADTPEKLLFGLAFRGGLPSDGAMLYIFEESGPHRVWTKEFQFPVDIIWLDESKVVIHIVEQADPCGEDRCPWFGPPPRDARYVVESNVGFVKREHVKIGDTVKFILHVS